MNKRFTTKSIATVAILGAIGAVLMFFDFPIAIAPSFYKLDLSDLPCLIASFALGPFNGLLTVIIKIVIKLLLKPTSTAFVGELAVLIVSGAYVFVAGYIYQKQKTKKQAIKALIIATIIMALVGSIANYLFIIPSYVSLYNISLEDIISMGQAIFPFIKDKLSFVICCVFPFNLIKAIIVDVVIMIIYKHISPILK